MTCILRSAVHAHSQEITANKNECFMFKSNTRMHTQRGLKSCSFRYIIHFIGDWKKFISLLLQLTKYVL